MLLLREQSSVMCIRLANIRVSGVEVVMEGIIERCQSEIEISAVFLPAGRNPMSGSGGVTKWNCIGLLDRQWKRDCEWAEIEP